MTKIEQMAEEYASLKYDQFYTTTGKFEVAAWTERKEAYLAGAASQLQLLTAGVDGFPPRRFIPGEITPGANVAYLERDEATQRGIGACHELISIEEHASLRAADLARVKVLELALGNWIKWEREQVRKEGPYAGAEITRLIADGEKALEVNRG